MPGIADTIQTSFKTAGGKYCQYEGPNTLSAGTYELRLDYSGLGLAGIIGISNLKKMFPTTFGGSNSDRTAGWIEQAYASGLNQAIAKWQNELQKNTDGGSVASVRPTKTEIIWQDCTIPGDDGNDLSFKAPSEVIITFEVRSVIIPLLLVMAFIVACNQLFPEASKAVVREVVDVVGAIGDGIGDAIGKPLGAIALPVAVAIVAFLIFFVWAK